MTADCDQPATPEDDPSPTWQGVLTLDGDRLHPDPPLPVHPPGQWEHALRDAVRRYFGTPTLEEGRRQTLEELAAEGLNPTGPLRFVALAALLPREDAPPAPYAHARLYDAPSGEAWTGPDQDADPAAVHDLLDEHGAFLASPPTWQATPSLTDEIQVYRGGPLAHHPFKPGGLGLNFRADVALHLRSPWLPVGDAGAHPPLILLTEFTLPAAQAVHYRMHDPHFQGRVAIHSMIVPQEAAGGHVPFPELSGAPGILIQAVITEVLNTDPERDLTRVPCELLGSVLRAVDEEGRPDGPAIAVARHAPLPGPLPAAQDQALRRSRLDRLRQLAELHLGWLPVLASEAEEPDTHLTAGGHPVRVVHVEREMHHPPLALTGARLDRVLTGLKREAPQVWRRLPDVWRAGGQDAASLLRLLPEGASHLAQRVLTAGVWRLTRGVYQIDETVYRALIHDTRPPEDLPTAQLAFLPAQSVYLSTPGLEDAHGLEVWGAFVTVLASDAGGEQMGFVALHGEGDHLSTFRFPVGERVAVGEAVREQLRRAVDGDALALAATPDPFTAQLVLRVLTLALYLASVGAEHTPRARTPGTDKGGLPLGNVVHDVGIRLGAALRQAREQEGAGASQDAGAAPGEQVSGGGQARSRSQPHIRRAHFHAFRHGPMSLGEDRPLRVRWLPPIPVNMELGEDLPTVVRPVQA